jgi:hypothetical protein
VVSPLEIQKPVQVALPGKMETCSKAISVSQINKILSQTETTNYMQMKHLADYECVEKWHSISNLFINDTL